jgi:hypothetical protein
MDLGNPPSSHLLIFPLYFICEQRAAQSRRIKEGVSLVVRGFFGEGRQLGCGRAADDHPSYQVYHRSSRARHRRHKRRTLRVTSALGTVAPIQATNQNNR